jgi:hypothetical protein
LPQWHFGCWSKPSSFSGRRPKARPRRSGKFCRTRSFDRCPPRSDQPFRRGHGFLPSAVPRIVPTFLGMLECLVRLMPPGKPNPSAAGARLQLYHCGAESWHWAGEVRGDSGRNPVGGGGILGRCALTTSRLDHDGHAAQVSPGKRGGPGGRECGGYLGR